MGKKIILSFLMALLFSAAGAAGKRFTLVIDPGHGGHDAGALGAFSKEKNINLNVALAFGRYVEKHCPDVRVIYTRKTDVFITLHERANIANRNKADLFVSVHTNALPRGKTARGLETYTLGMHRAADNLDVAKRENSVILVEKDYKQHYEGFDPRSAESYIMFEFMQDKNMVQSVDMARYVQRRVCASAGRPDKGVKQAGFLVLRETSMPSCLIELGFITTPDEERLLNTESSIDALGYGIYKAFMDYRQKYDKTITVPYIAEEKRKVPVPTVVPDAEEPKKPAGRKKKESESVIEELKSARGEEPAAVKAPEEAQPDTVPQAAAAEPAVPVFKVQILASNRNLRPGSQQFKGIDGVECYEEGGMYKYTYGSSADYNEIYRLRKEILDRFPEAFIIAFKGGAKVNVVEAIREFKQNRNKKQSL
ncbi:MAG: N-acetylmuramoyl-L-alanine amidase [Prevotella sp.]|nr:N-acetylmuramoyl-L-alanine amidase [Prevotella sp.]